MEMFSPVPLLLLQFWGGLKSNVAAAGQVMLYHNHSLLDDTSFWSSEMAPYGVKPFHVPP